MKEQVKAKKEKNSLASVIIPSYNRAHRITKALDSVYAQTYRPIEVLVIDDGSKDHTKEVVKNWAKEKDDQSFTTHYISQENSGAPVARNTGIKNAYGRYLQFFDSDDLLLPEKLKLQIKLMQKENTPVCICDYMSIDEEGNVLNIASNKRSHNQMVHEYQALHTSIGIIDKTKFKKGIPLWNPKIVKLQDRDFYIKLLLIINDLSYVPKTLFKWIRHSEEGIYGSPQNMKKVIWTNFKSLLIFNLKNIQNISVKKYPFILRLYVKLIYRAIGIPIGHFVPESLRFWAGWKKNRIQSTSK